MFISKRFLVFQIFIMALAIAFLVVAGRLMSIPPDGTYLTNEELCSPFTCVYNFRNKVEEFRPLAIAAASVAGFMAIFGIISNAINSKKCLRVESILRLGLVGLSLATFAKGIPTTDAADEVHSYCFFTGGETYLCKTYVPAATAVLALSFINAFFSIVTAIITNCCVLPEGGCCGDSSPSSIVIAPAPVYNPPPEKTQTPSYVPPVQKVPTFSPDFYSVPQQVTNIANTYTAPQPSAYPPPNNPYSQPQANPYTPPPYTPAYTPTEGPSSSDDKKCIICLEADKDTIFIPCYHLACCPSCANKLINQPCPVCRTTIAQVHKVYNT